jgi:hypothetical protein
VRLQFRFLTALFALLAVVGLAACGGGDDEGGGNEGDATALLKETFSGDKKVNSGNLTVALSLKGEGNAQLSQPVSLKLTGPFQNEGEQQLPKFDLNLSVNAAGQSFSAGAVSTGDAGYLKLQGQAYDVPDQVFQQFKEGFEKAQSEQSGDDNRSFASLGINPSNWVTDAKEEGTETVGGAETTHVSAQIDVPKMLTDVNELIKKAGSLGGAQAQQLPNEITAEQRKQIGDAVKEAKIDVYTGTEDKILRKLTLALNFELTDEQASQAQGLKSGDLSFDIEIANLNQPQNITAPANPKPFTELQSALGSLAGLAGAGGASSGGSTSSGGSDGTQNEKVQQYTQCLQDAQGDVQKAQECAQLLQP